MDDWEDDWDDDGFDDDDDQHEEGIPFGISALSLSGVFWDYSKWSDEVVDKVVDYKVKFGIFPNALIAAEDTLDTLCEASETWENVDDDEGETDEDMASRIRADFKECKDYDVDDMIEFGLPQLFLGNKIISPLYKLRLLCDETMENGIYRLSWIENLPQDNEGEEGLNLDSIDEEEESEKDNPPDKITLDDLDTGEEDLGDEDDESLDEESKKKRAWAKVARSFKEIAKEDEQLSEEEKRIRLNFMKKIFLVMITYQKHYLGVENPPKLEKTKSVPIEIVDGNEHHPAGEDFDFTGEEVADFFEGVNPEADEFIDHIISLTEIPRLSPTVCEVRGEVVHFVFPIEKGKMRKIIKGGHAQELHDNCLKVADAFKEVFEWSGDVEFDFPDE